MQSPAHVVAIALILALSGTPSIGALQAEPGRANVVEYSVDPAQLKTNFRETGSLDVILPGVGKVTVTGAEADLFVRKEVIVVGDSRDDVLEERPLTDIPIEGSVKNVAGSVARITLGKYGIYGMIMMGGAEYVLNPQQVDGAYVQKTVLKPAVDPLVNPTPNGIEDPSADSWVVFDAEPSYWSGIGDWDSRITSAFNLYESLWDGAAIDLRLYGIYQLQINVLRVDRGEMIFAEDAKADYRRWLSEGGIISGVDGYELWSGADLWRNMIAYPDRDILGTAHADTVGTGAAASAVMEGYDLKSGDNYDPDESDDRGAISGHELGHVYGEENHPSHCRTSSECNLMRQGFSEATAFYFVTSTESEIYERFFNDQEYA